MKPVLVFDLNETLLDMSALDPACATIFGLADGSEIRRVWFKQVLELFLTANVTDRYRPFDQLTRDALDMTASARGGRASPADHDTLVAAMGTIHSYPDVRPGLEALRTAGFTVATLTNSTGRAATQLVEQAGLRPLFHSVLSVDAVQRFKPAKEAYAYAARSLDVSLEAIVLVAAHSWDVAGAMAAGCRAAFIARPHQVLSPGVPEPQYLSANIAELAAQLVAAER